MKKIVMNPKRVTASEDMTTSHCWYGVYWSAMDQKKHPCYLSKSATKDAEEAARLMEDIIPEPYSKFKFVGTARIADAKAEGATELFASTKVTASEGAPQEYTTEEELLAAGYEELQFGHKSAGKNYCLYRKLINGKADWWASDWNTRENVQHITYAQASGAEDINPTPVSRLGRELGKKLLPQTRVQSATKPFKEGDKVKYMGKDTVVRKVEYDKQYGYDYLIDNPDWSEENYPNDVEGKFQKIWVGSEVTAATQLSGGFSPLDAAHYAIEKVSHMCRQIGKRKVGHIDIDDLSCSNDTISFDVILYTNAGRPFSQDTFSTSIHFDDANSENEDDVKWIIDNKVYEFAYNMIHNPVKPSRPAFGSKSVKASSEVKRTFIVQQYMKEEDEYGPKFNNVHEANTHEAADEWLSKHLGDNELAPSEFRIIQCSTITPKNAGLTSTVQKLINDKVLEIMQTESFGFPADEAAEYSRVEVTQADHSYLRVEVRVELSYDSMWEMKELLDPIISKMDQDAYFDMDQPGIMSAYVNINKLKAWGKDLANITAAYRPGEIPEPPLEPPEPAYADGDDYEEVIEIDVQTEIGFDETGDTVYAYGNWMENPDREDGNWVDDNGVMLMDSDQVFEEFDYLMKKDPNCPDGTGNYRVSGKLLLHFTVSGIYMEDDDYEQETNANYSEASATYDRSQSRIENLTFTEWTTVESATELKGLNKSPLSDGYFIYEYNNGTKQITKPRPYDDAEYYYGFHNGTNWLICKSGKIFKTISEDDIDSLDDIVEELEMVNSGIEPKMMYN